jgi:hypothetical protein
MWLFYWGAEVTLMEFPLLWELGQQGCRQQTGEQQKLLKEKLCEAWLISSWIEPSGHNSKITGRGFSKHCLTAVRKKVVKNCRCSSYLE